MSKEVSITELRNKSHAEMTLRAMELKKSIFLCRSAGVGDEEKKMSKKKREARKELARILTIKREREMNEIPREPLL